ncbi:hypothetical protein [Wolbachia endosymbiont of Mansonella ozzardi]|uniref:hypothetical protein n=1 Tax=Wolbachia endosymbiont of Mansonella ozzardi TaxID=137464 RepID=UPI001CE039E9|nr:hypothetical protein [Wolbachia endosymbiont of Mansonella ozzardi]
MLGCALQTLQLELVLLQLQLLFFLVQCLEQDLQFNRCSDRSHSTNARLFATAYIIEPIAEKVNEYILSPMIEKVKECFSSRKQEVN